MMRMSCVVLGMLVVLAGCTNPQQIDWTQQYVPASMVQEYTGIIQNCSRQTVSVPSANSDGSLIVPPRGWMEFTAYMPSIELEGYVDGKKRFAQRVVVMPRHYTFMGKQYDFIAQIVLEDPAPVPRPCPKEVDCPPYNKLKLRSRG